jgi:hypothetical protein
MQSDCYLVLHVCFILFPVLGMDPKALCMLDTGKHSDTEPNPSLALWF